MPLPPGSRLGPDEIVALVGAGGMGEVYRADDVRLDRTVAIKILPGSLAGTPGFRSRFEREARAISAVEHPHICALYDIGSRQPIRPETDGREPASPPESAGANEPVDFLVMQFVDGETLAHRIGRGPMPPAEAARAAAQIAAGLEAAHERGILHRDLKPSNIKLTAGGDVKILDFGLAKALDPHGHPGASEAAFAHTFSATQAGVVLGTATYMSPEQVRAKALDRRTDIWSFGCVLFEMLAGRPPFQGETVADVLANVLEREPDWTALPRTTPEGLRLLLRRCLRKDASRRLRDIGDARLELEELDATGEARAAAGNAGSPARPRRAVLPWILATAALLVAGVAIAALAVTVFGPRSPARAPMRFSAVTNFSGVESQPSFSPDGRSVAFVSNREGQWDIYVTLVTGGSLVRVTNDTHYEARPRWSPDGTRLLYARLEDSGLYDIRIVPAFSGAATRVVANGVHPAWSPDGRSIAYSSGGAMWVADSNGANPRQVTRPEARFSDLQPAFSHDGRSLAFVRRRAGATNAPYGALALADLEAGTLRYLTGDDALALSPAWSPDDRFVYFAGTHGGALNVWKIPAAGGEAEQITAGQGDDTDIDLSPDGRRLVFSSFRVNVNLAQLSLERAAGGRMEWLTRDLARGEAAPRYSPDGPKGSSGPPGARVGAMPESKSRPANARARVTPVDNGLSLEP